MLIFCKQLYPTCITFIACFSLILIWFGLKLCKNHAALGHFQISISISFSYNQINDSLIKKYKKVSKIISLSICGLFPELFSLCPIIFIFSHTILHLIFIYHTSPPPPHFYRHLKFIFRLKFIILKFILCKIYI